MGGAPLCPGDFNPHFGACFVFSQLSLSSGHSTTSDIDSIQKVSLPSSTSATYLSFFWGRSSPFSREDVPRFELLAPKSQGYTSFLLLLTYTFSYDLFLALFIWESIRDRVIMVSASCPTLVTAKEDSRARADIELRVIPGRLT